MQDEETELELEITDEELKVKLKFYAWEYGSQNFHQLLQFLFSIIIQEFSSLQFEYVLPLNISIFIVDKN